MTRGAAGAAAVAWPRGTGSYSASSLIGRTLSMARPLASVVPGSHPEATAGASWRIRLPQVLSLLRPRRPANGAAFSCLLGVARVLAGASPMLLASWLVKAG